jgi:3-oxoacyl-[acyl-carrier protein] reductase
MSETAGRLASRAAFVTGAASGIGRGIAAAFVREGARVAVADRNGGAARRVAAELGASAVAVELDVTDPGASRRAIDAFAETAGGLDILVNNAGIAWDAPLPGMSDAQWDAVLRVNLYGGFHCTRAALRHMIGRRRGRIINMSSIVGAYGEPNQANYAASKGALVAFTKTVAKEVASRGITANAIAPGFIVTPLTDQMPVDVRKRIVEIVPLGRAGLPEDIASAAVFLASDEAGYITGQVLHVNGGLLI